MTDPTTRLAHAPAVLQRRCPDRTLLHDGDQLHVLEGTASWIWERFAVDATVEEVVAEASAAVRDAGGDAGPVADDVAGLVDRLVDLGILVPT